MNDIADIANYVKKILMFLLLLWMVCFHMINSLIAYLSPSFYLGSWIAYLVLFEGFLPFAISSSIVATAKRQPVLGLLTIVSWIAGAILFGRLPLNSLLWWLPEYNQVLVMLGTITCAGIIGIVTSSVLILRLFGQPCRLGRSIYAGLSALIIVILATCAFHRPKLDFVHLTHQIAIPTDGSSIESVAKLLSQQAGYFAQIPHTSEGRYRVQIGGCIVRIEGQDWAIECPNGRSESIPRSIVRIVMIKDKRVTESVTTDISAVVVFGADQIVFIDRDTIGYFTLPRLPV